MENISYLKDESGNIISPIVSDGSIIKKDGEGFNDLDLQYASEIIYFGEHSGGMTLANGSWNYFVPNSTNILKYGTFDTTNGFTVPYNGYYELETHFNVARKEGVGENIAVGFCINKDCSNGSLGMWQYREYRSEFNYSAVIHLTAGDTIHLKYYLDSSATATLDGASMTVKLLRKTSIEAIDKTSNVKYVKDSKDNIFSPIVSGSSCYTYEGKKLINEIKNKGSLDAFAYYYIFTCSSTTDTANISYLNSVTTKKVYQNPRNVLSCTSSGMPFFIVTKTGYYNIGLTMRVYDDTTSVQDYRFAIGVNRISDDSTERISLSTGRMKYRLGMSGGKTLWLQRGDVVYPRFWKDYIFTQFQYMTFTIQSVSIDNVTTSWTQTEAMAFCERFCSVYNGHINTEQSQRSLYYYETSGENDEYVYYITDGKIRAYKFHFGRQNGYFYCEDDSDMEG